MKPDESVYEFLARVAVLSGRPKVFVDELLDIAHKVVAKLKIVNLDVSAQIGECSFGILGLMSRLHEIGRRIVSSPHPRF